MDDVITDVYPQARVIAYADDCVVLHEDRQVLEHCQQLLMTWLAAIGLTRNEAKSHIHHTLEGDQPGFDFLGFHIRQYRMRIPRISAIQSTGRFGSWPIYVNAEEVSQFEWISEPTLTR
jgi:hypothetical protein